MSLRELVDSRFQNLGTNNLQPGSKERIYVFQGLSLLEHINTIQGSLQVEDPVLAPEPAREDVNGKRPRAQSTSDQIPPAKKLQGPPASQSRSQRRTDSKFKNPQYKKQTIQASPSGGSYNICSTGWQGTNRALTEDGKTVIKDWYNFNILKQLACFTQVPYDHIHNFATSLRDSSGRQWGFRSFRHNRIANVMDSFIEQAKDLVAAVDANHTGFSEAEMQGNARGPHWNCNMGYDRNIKKLPQQTAWHRRNKELADGFFARDSPAFIINAAMNHIYLVQFPALARRFEACRTKLGISKDEVYGCFFNFCLNMARPSTGLKRVHCEPHVDFKNLAIAVCVLFVYGHFNSREHCWLVIWEARVIIEVPSGVFLMYPSSLFFHFNVDICDVQYVVTNGELPNEADQNYTHLNGADGRGSCVWFNQASMFQTAELGYGTVGKARKAGVDVNCDTEVLLKAEHFPSSS